MNIIDHELKRHELWQEELSKKKKADILLEWRFTPLLPVAMSFGRMRWFCLLVFVLFVFRHSDYLGKCKSVLKVKMKTENLGMNIV